MKHTKFIIEFITMIQETVYAFSEREAVILAQAKQIKKGNQYKISHIWFYDKFDNKIQVK